MTKDKKQHRRRPVDQYKGFSASKPARQTSDWAGEKIRQMTLATEQGNFQSARRLLDELEANGLKHDGRQPLDVNLETFLASVFDVRITTMLERKFGVYTFRQLLQLPRSRLTEEGRIGPGIASQVITVCQRHFGKWEDT